jgi:hypothetical protein
MSVASCKGVVGRASEYCGIVENRTDEWFDVERRVESSSAVDVTG